LSEVDVTCTTSSSQVILTIKEPASKAATRQRGHPRSMPDTASSKLTFTKAYRTARPQNSKASQTSPAKSQKSHEAAATHSAGQQTWGCARGPHRIQNSWTATAQQSNATASMQPTSIVVSATISLSGLEPKHAVKASHPHLLGRPPQSHASPNCHGPRKGLYHHVFGL